MAEIKWIKLTTDIFNDEKILLIEELPDADTIIVIWFKLLCMAGKINNYGVFIMNNKMPYTEEMLATIFRRPLNTVRLALATFEAYGMIEIVDNVISIPNWEKHQNAEAMDKVREQTRLRVAKHREKQRLLGTNAGNSEDSEDQKECNANVTLPVTLRNATDKKEDKKKNKKEDKNIKHIYGAYAHVRLSDEEHNKLINEIGQYKTDACITYLDEYIEMKGYKAKNHYLCIKRWVIDAVEEKQRKQNKNVVDPEFVSNNGFLNLLESGVFDNE